MLRLGIIAPLFLVSGGTALLYQVAFGKKLATIFGATAYAVSAVLAAFMGGLALGSHIGGKLAGRARRPLVIYGIAEIVVGLVCAITPLLFEGIADAYVATIQQGGHSLALISAARSLITAAVVLVPTIAMGITLPMLAKAVADDLAMPDASKRRLAQLYAINTAGGAAGALLSAYLVLPWLGVYATMRAAALINIVIGLVAIYVGRNSHSADREAEHQGPSLAPPEQWPWLLLLAFASGLLVFATEVVDTHLLALLIGNSAYAFGLMLAVFLTCLSVGASLAGRWEAWLGPRALAGALSLSCAVLLLGLPLWGTLPKLFVLAGGVSSWIGRELVRGAAAASALLLPTICMGLTFPLLLRAVAGRADVGKRVGMLTAVNTMGSIVGSLLCGYWLLPTFGSQRSLKLVGMSFGACAIAAAWAQMRQQRAGLRIAGSGLVVAVASMLVLPAWDMMVMSNGSNVYFHARSRPDELLSIEEDVHGGLTSVERRGGLISLYTNGKFQGDNGNEITAQRSFAHFPSLFVKRHDAALVVGLGTGTTLGTVAAYPYRSIDVVEISPSIARAARTFFTVPNRRALDDPRVRLILGDGRNQLLIGQKRYDLITIEMTSVWFAGAANLYSAEFYQLCRERLRADGVLQQWVQLHHIRRQEVAVIVRTLRQSFAHVALFFAGGQGILVASNKPLIASRAQLSALSQREGLRATLGRRSSLKQLLTHLVSSGAELDRFVHDVAAMGGGAIISTDENLYLEYATPKGNVMTYEKSLRQMFSLIQRYRTTAVRSRHLGP